MAEAADLAEEPAAGSAVASLSVRAFARRCLAGCIAFEVLLVVLDHLIQFRKVIEDSSIRKIFNIAREESLPTWFSSTQTVCVGLTLLLIAPAASRRGAGRWSRLGWILFGCFFVFLGIDDAAEIHERVGSALGRAAEDGAAGGGGTLQQLLDFTYAWQVFLAPVYGLVGLALVVFLWRELRRHGQRTWFVVGIACLAFATGLDFLEGIENLHDDLAKSLAVEAYTVSHTGKVIEEFLEMLGMSLVWRSFLGVLAAVADGLVVRVRR